ncbi:hypothetical protein [Pseudoalteromonas sp. MMG012]|uniref:hypothetical protein n=1 Tax=Pseudoalteromonas sp. MMG012 TaxID=2822686 RepID=UPI001B3A5A43|nr:hypothetical protein [Pseudoalteromonas sp. MMG012]MBQ4849773.1 hypothetical protein [Pseudoalteromonas sp. MMG012]
MEEKQNKNLEFKEYLLDLEDVTVVTRYCELPDSYSLIKSIEDQEALKGAITKKPLFWGRVCVDNASLSLEEAVYICHDKRKVELLKRFATEHPFCQIEQVTIAQSCYYALLMTKQALSQSTITDFFDVFFEFSRPQHQYRATFYYPFDLQGETTLKNRLNIDANNSNKRKVILNDECLTIKAKRYEFHKVGTDPADWTTVENNQVQTFLYYNPQAQACFFGEKGGSKKINAFEEYQLELSNCYIGIDNAKSKQARNKRKQSSVFGDTLQDCEVADFTQNELTPCAKITQLSLIRHPISRGSFLLAINAEYSPTQDIFKYAASTLRTVQKIQNQPLYAGTIYDEAWWWCILLAPSDLTLAKSMKQMQLGRWLNFSQKARILYPTFVEQKEEEKIDCLVLLLNNTEHLTYDGEKPRGLEDLKQQKDNRQPISRYVMRLVSLFFNDDASSTAEQNDVIKKLDPYSHNQHDSRLYLNATYGLCGNYPKTSLGEDVLAQTTSLATMVDVENNRFDFYPTGYAYNQEFVTKLIDDQSYRRWKGISSETGFNEYATVTVGFGGYTADCILPHWHTIYRHFFHYALLTREALTCFKRTMNKATDQLAQGNTSSKPENNYREIRRNFILFMNRYWFKQLSHEQQGLEVFEQIQRATSLDEHFDMVKEQVSFADDYMESWRNIYFVNKADNTGQIAALLALIAIVTAWPKGLNVFSLEFIDRMTLIILIGLAILFGVKSKLFAAIYSCLNFISFPSAKYQYLYQKLMSFFPISSNHKESKKSLAEQCEEHWESKLQNLKNKTNKQSHVTPLKNHQGEAMYALIKVEAVNFGNSLGISNNLSVYRGTSMLLRNSVLQIAQKLDNLEVISLGGSVGIYKTNNNDAEELVSEIKNRLNADYQGMNFVVNYKKHVTDSTFNKSKDALINDGRLLQLQQMSVSFKNVPDALNADGSKVEAQKVCELSHVLPASEHERVQSADKPVNTILKTLFLYGRDQKQTFYESELAQYSELAKVSNPKTIKRFYTQSFEQICNDDGIAHLDNKLAYLYFDGNKFSKIQQNYVESADDQLSYDKHIRQLRGELLDKLLNYLDNQKDALFEDTITIDGQEQNISRIKLETLLWGGDETLFVLPASQGFKVLAKLMEWTKDWSISKQVKQENGALINQIYPLTHAFGLVFCQHKTPVSTVRSFATNLADEVKKVALSAVVKQKEVKEKETRLSSDEPKQANEQHINIDGTTNCYSVAVLESIDITTLDVNDYFSHSYGEMSQQRANILPNEFNTDDLSILGANLTESFPKSAIYNLAKQYKNPEALLEAEQRLSYVTGLREEKIVEFIKLASDVLIGKPLDLTKEHQEQRAIMWVLLTEYWEYIALHGNKE